MLLEAIPTVPDVQSAWLLLLHCASARANYLLRVVRPEWVEQFALSHDESVWSCLCTFVRISAYLGQEHEDCLHVASLVGWLGLAQRPEDVCGGILGQLGRFPHHDTGASSHCDRQDSLLSGRAS